MEKKLSRKLLYIFLFAIAFAFVESSVVIYLRKIYYPEGFQFPIKRSYDAILIIEVIREFATIVMMASLGVLLSRKFWEGFGYFLIIFGIWDIFFYIWLKAAINWPASVMDFDILFLIPVPWIAPVLVPVIISAVMIIIGYDIVRMFDKGYNVKPGLLHWGMVLAGVAVLFYTFMSDTGAAFYEKYPEPYNWLLFAVGIGLFAIAHLLLRKRTMSS
ncbi:MAG: hypothetical protein EHM58_04855 [Ignavibacteriae bacterium]|nr:MAG: hypothetical protein EHM58_04855 [Ignavibacteriota bacterium]